MAWSVDGEGDGDGDKVGVGDGGGRLVMHGSLDAV